MRYFYRGAHGATNNRFQHRQQEAHPAFVIGQGFENHDFSRAAVPFADALRHRLEQLRDTKKYLRFWFSGGKDSRLILDTSIKTGIEFDEIVVIKNAMLGEHQQFGALSEIMHNAVDYLNMVSNTFKKTRVTIRSFQENEYACVFEHPDWIYNTNAWYIHSAIEPVLFYRYVNPYLTLLEDIPDRIDLMGNVHPHVYWNQGWRFFYVDFQFSQNLWPTCENFLTSPEHPEIAHSYVKALITQLESQGRRLERFGNDISEFGNQNLRCVRELLKEYQFNILRPDLELPKVYLDPWRPNEDAFWRANPSYKSVLTCLNCIFAKSRPRAFDLYANTTDWTTVLSELEFGGILTQEFTL